MTERSGLDDLLAPLIERALPVANFQLVLAACTSAAGRKTMIMTGFETGVLEAADTALLIQVYQLETA